MSERTIGKGRGAVFAGGKVYLEGAAVPDDVQVGDHVFDDVDPVEGNQAVAPVKAITVEADSDADGSGSDGPADGTVEEVLGRVGDDKAAAQVALDAEQAKGDKARKSLVEKLQAVIDADGSGSGS